MFANKKSMAALSKAGCGCGTCASCASATRTHRSERAGHDDHGDSLERATGPSRGSADLRDRGAATSRFGYATSTAGSEGSPTVSRQATAEDTHADSASLGESRTHAVQRSPWSWGQRAPVGAWLGYSEPRSDGSSNKPEEPFGEYNDEMDGVGDGPAVAAVDAPETTPSEAAANTTPPGQPATAPAPPATAPAPPATAPAQPAATAAAATRTVIRGPREMWNFNGQSPASYPVSAPLSTNRSGGVFNWSTSAHLTISSATAARPTVTTALPSVPPGRDAWIRVRHTDATGTRTAASYRLTILAPDSLTHLNDVDTSNTGFGYNSDIHYSIHDQFGTVLPRNVPLNEQFTGASVQDFPGGNWGLPPQCGPTGVCPASFNPADFHDHITGVGVVGSVPTPVAPTDPDAAVAAQHWPGDWFIGGQTPGTGRRVRTVTWQRNRGFARHT